MALSSASQYFQVWLQDGFESRNTDAFYILICIQILYIYEESFPQIIVISQSYWVIPQSTPRVQRIWKILFQNFPLNCHERARHQYYWIVRGHSYMISSLFSFCAFTPGLFLFLFSTFPQGNLKTRTGELSKSWNKWDWKSYIAHIVWFTHCY